MEFEMTGNSCTLNNRSRVHVSHTRRSASLMNVFFYVQGRSHTQVSRYPSQQQRIIYHTYSQHQRPRACETH